MGNRIQIERKTHTHTNTQGRDAEMTARVDGVLDIVYHQVRRPEGTLADEGFPLGDWRRCSFVPMCPG